MSAARILDRAGIPAYGVNATALEQYDLADSALDFSAPTLRSYIGALQLDFLKSFKQPNEPLGQLLGKELIEPLDVDIALRPDRLPEVSSQVELEDYRAQAPARRVFSYVSERIAGEVKCKPSLEPLVNVAEAAHARGIEIIIAPVEARFNGAIYLREHVTCSVLNAAERLLDATKGEVTLKFYDGYRPLEDQRRLFDKYRAEFAAAMPGASDQEIWDRVTQVVADPDLTPPHSTGGAVDLTLAWTRTHVELDMGSGVNELTARASTWCRDLSATQEYNRLLLLGTMTSAGFYNLPTEFWHYSQGDPYHTLFCGEAQAKYASISSLDLHPVICSKFNARQRHASIKQYSEA